MLSGVDDVAAAHRPLLAAHDLELEQVALAHRHAEEMMVSDRARRLRGVLPVEWGEVAAQADGATIGGVAHLDPRRQERQPRGRAGGRVRFQEPEQRIECPALSLIRSAPCALGLVLAVGCGSSTLPAATPEETTSRDHEKEGFPRCSRLFGIPAPERERGKRWAGGREC